jgi:ferrochelatase
MPLTYQSRSGRRKWLEPGTKETVRRLAREGIRNLSIVAPGFAADGVETLEELDMRARDCFLGAGGENFTYVPCLNDSDLSISMLAKLINEDMSGWA